MAVRSKKQQDWMLLLKILQFYGVEYIDIVENEISNKYSRLVFTDLIIYNELKILHGNKLKCFAT